MKIRITFNITKLIRQAINESIGKPGLADRDTIIAMIEGAVDESLSNLQANTNQEEDEIYDQDMNMP